MKRIPHTFTIVFALIVFAAVLTWVVPAGEFVRETIDVNGSSREVVVNNSFHYTERAPQTWQIFSALFNGFVDKADIIIFILMVGGAFWILNNSHAIDVGVMAFLRWVKRLSRYKIIKKLGVENIIITLVMLLFSLFGAVFGMSEETIAFVVVFIPLAIQMGYDSIVGVCMCYVAAHVGFAGAMLNPFTIGIAQGIADLPLFSGLEYRLFCWVVLTIVGIAFVLWYARRVKARPESSPVYKLDDYWRSRMESSEESRLTVRQILILVLFFVTIVALVVGVLKFGWYIEEISALFLAMGILAGIIDRQGADDIAKLFLAGCKDILSAALVVGLASGIIFILKDGCVIDTILYGLTRSLAQVGDVVSLGAMYVFQTLLNVVMPSGSAKAALTMPIMAQFADLIDVSRQTTVLAFQFGDGFTNMLTPTSGVLIGVLGMARIPYGTWLKWVWKFIVALIVLGFILMLPTLWLDLPGF
ncbi:MAG: YfcC family protein [Prevotella sp.]|nr:YfcC family protein [Bacteroidales bacterium]MBQ6653722.1 YfcC family protein [Prevotella sp.]